MKPSRGYLVACALAFATACSDTRDKAQQQASGDVLSEPDCPSAVSITSSWPQFDARSVPARFTLPPGTAEIQAPEGQNWRLPGGSFAYRLEKLVPASQDTGRTPPWCATEVAGRRVAVRFFFGEATFGRRGYLTAEIPISHDSVMEIVASSYDSAGVDTLIAALRAVQVRVP
jgi:hypothetical protein